MMSQPQGKQDFLKARRFCKKEPLPFNNNVEVIEAANYLFDLRKSSDSKVVKLKKHFRKIFHKCLNLSSEKLHIINIFKKYRFNQTEKEVLLLFIIGELGMYKKTTDLESIQKAMNQKDKKGIAIAKSLCENGRLSEIDLSGGEIKNVVLNAARLSLVREANGPVADLGRAVCTEQHIDPGSKTTESLEHKFWINRATKHFEKQGYEVKCEHPVKGNGAIDILASKPGQKIAVEVETGKSDIKKNISKIKNAGFDRIVLVATSPTAVSACQKVIDANGKSSTVELLSWLDIS